MTARQLFPHLPPELRNEIYNYASLPDAKTPPTTEGLPLKLKTFTDKHTVIQIVPVHHGNPALLSLQRYNYQEAKEYSSYLLGNAVSLFISIHFKGRSNTFIHEHWAKKISAHLNKLAKMYPWLRKVSTYDIRILWNDKDVMLKGRKRTAGKIASDILRTALGLAGRDMLKKKGDVKVTLSVAPWIIKAIQRCKGVFGYREFLSANGFEGVRRVARQIRGAPGQRHSGYYEVENAPGFVVAGDDEEITLLAVEERKVKWNDWTEGWLFASERVEQVVGGGMKVVKERKGNPLVDAVILEGDERTW